LLDSPFFDGNKIMHDNSTLLRAAKMTKLLIVSLALTLTWSASCPAQDKPAAEKRKSNPLDFLRLGDAAQAAQDFRNATETLERVMSTSGPLIQVIAESVGSMSSEFDPFGYKTAFRTIGQQTELIQQQQQMIQELQERENERLRKEVQELKDQLQTTKPSGSDSPGGRKKNRAKTN
jgi:hypothetical protein